MNAWLIAATVLMFGLVPCGLVCIRGDTIDRLVALELAGILSIILTVMLAEGLARPSLYDLALALALLSFPAMMVFAHFLERWL